MKNLTLLALLLVIVTIKVNIIIKKRHGIGKYQRIGRVRLREPALPKWEPGGQSSIRWMSWTLRPASRFDTSSQSRWRRVRCVSR